MKLRTKLGTLYGLVIITTTSAACASGFPSNTMEFVMTNVTVAGLLDRVSQKFDISICREFSKEDISGTNRIDLFLKNACCKSVLDALTEQRNQYMWCFDEAAKVVNVFPRDGSLLDWQAPAIDVENLSLATFLWGKIRKFDDWKKRNIFCEPWSGNTQWAENYRITLKRSPMPIRGVLNEVCQQTANLSTNMIWWWELSPGEPLPVFQLKKRKK